MNPAIEANYRYWQKERGDAHCTALLSAIAFVLFLAGVVVALFILPSALIGGVSTAGVVMSLARLLIALLDLHEARSRLRALDSSVKFLQSDDQ